MFNYPNSRQNSVSVIFKRKGSSSANFLAFHMTLNGCIQAYQNSCWFWCYLCWLVHSWIVWVAESGWEARGTIVIVKSLRCRLSYLANHQVKCLACNSTLYNHELQPRLAAIKCIYYVQCARCGKIFMRGCFAILFLTFFLPFFSMKTSLPKFLWCFEFCIYFSWRVTAQIDELCA